MDRVWSRTRLAHDDLYEIQKKELSQLLLALIHRVCLVYVTAGTVLLYCLEKWLQFRRGLNLCDKFG